MRISATDPNYTLDLCIEKAWAVVLHCRCGHISRLGLDDLRAMPKDGTLHGVAVRARCTACADCDVHLYTVNARTVTPGWHTA